MDSATLLVHVFQLVLFSTMAVLCLVFKDETIEYVIQKYDITSEKLISNYQTYTPISGAFFAVMVIVVLFQIFL